MCATQTLRRTKKKIMCIPFAIALLESLKFRKTISLFASFGRFNHAVMGNWCYIQLMSITINVQINHCKCRQFSFIYSCDTFPRQLHTHFGRPMHMNIKILSTKTTLTMNMAGNNGIKQYTILPDHNWNGRSSFLLNEMSQRKQKMHAMHQLDVSVCFFCPRWFWHSFNKIEYNINHNYTCQHHRQFWEMARQNRTKLTSYIVNFHYDAWLPIHLA